MYDVYAVCVCVKHQALCVWERGGGGMGVGWVYDVLVCVCVGGSKCVTWCCPSVKGGRGGVNNVCVGGLSVFWGGGGEYACWQWVAEGRWCAWWPTSGVCGSCGSVLGGSTLSWAHCGLDSWLAGWLSDTMCVHTPHGVPVVSPMQVKDLEVTMDRLVVGGCGCVWQQ